MPPSRFFADARWARAMRGRRAYVMAAALVLAAVAARAMMIPVWGGHHAYSGFFPAVLLATFVGGRRAGLAATALAAAVGYWVFLPPSLAFKLNLDSLSYTLTFLASCTVAVLLIAGLNETLARISREHEEARALAERHADLFREINDRVSHHLNLVASLLALQSEGEPSLEVSDAFARASEMSISLSALHREWAGASAEPVDVMPFAAALLRAKLASLRRPADGIVLEGESFQASPADATSLGVALLECAGALGGGAGRLEIGLSSRDGEIGIVVRRPAALLSDDAPGAGDLAGLTEAPLLRAVVRQARGRMSLQEDGGRLSLRIALGGGADPGALPPRSLH